MKPMLKIFLFYQVSSFLVGAAIYTIAARALELRWVFGSLYRMFEYHMEHPFQYVFVVSVCFASVATGYACKVSASVGWKRRIRILAILVASIVVASVPGGVLWKVHDMQAGYFPQGMKFWSDLAEGAVLGLQLGWLIVLLSFPYNLCCAFVAYWLVVGGMRLAPPKQRVSQRQTT